ncbi:uncharacterized protein PAC_03239 [Phialocephala subalpina]|uniref:Uncharacterized protein n=1 Tax=Phialocephala subalpina TaxID=576137 RepID=A0A1L7WKR8_9HELO|nr:uncharacterized protein PAC_03239 [Phialocephala subalpina]
MAPTSEKDQPPPYTSRHPHEQASASTSASSSRYYNPQVENNGYGYREMSSQYQNPRIENNGYGYREMSEPATGQRGLGGILGGRREGRRDGGGGGGGGRGGGRLQRHREKKAARREGLMSLVSGVMGRR